MAHGRRMFRTLSNVLPLFLSVMTQLSHLYSDRMTDRFWLSRVEKNILPLIGMDVITQYPSIV